MLNKKVDSSVFVRTGILRPNTFEDGGGQHLSDNGSVVSEVSMEVDLLIQI